MAGIHKQIRSSLVAARRFSLRSVCFVLSLTFVVPMQAAENVNDAEASFHYIVSTLKTFNDSGRLVNNPGIDGADLEHFILLLREAYRDFSGDFNSESAMCRFYRDPENSRMTIEERAEISFSYLRDLESRIERIETANLNFKEELELQFGRIVLENIGTTKLNSMSSQRLPASQFDEAATISFLDAMCS